MQLFFKSKATKKLKFRSTTTSQASAPANKVHFFLQAQQTERKRKKNFLKMLAMLGAKRVKPSTVHSD